MLSVIALPAYRSLDVAAVKLPWIRVLMIRLK